MTIRALWGLMALLVGCQSVRHSLSDRPCQDGQCLDGYECHPTRGICVPKLQRGCDGAGICWTKTTTGAACSPPASFLPCGPGNDCGVYGCRHCKDGVWTCCQDEKGEQSCRPDKPCIDQDQDGLGNGTFDNVGCMVPFVDVNDADPTTCHDSDGDACDDCTSRVYSPAQDGPDGDQDGICDKADLDDDNDGILDAADSEPLDPSRCQDTDQDGCDDCSKVPSGVGLSADPLNDGVDLDGDGWCNVVDCHDGLGGETIYPRPTEASDASEAACTDGFDNDCDGETDRQDPDCTWLGLAWRFRKPIVVQSGRVVGSHTDFPFLVSLDSDAELQAHAAHDGHDIVFTGDDGFSRLHYELESYDGDTGSLLAWVRLPSLSQDNDTTMYLYYGASQEGDSQPRHGVWDKDYAAVWHMDGLGEEDLWCGHSICDSGIGEHHGVAKRNAHDAPFPTSTPGKIGQGAEFFGRTPMFHGGWLEVPHDTRLNGLGEAVTISAWTLLTGAQLEDVGVMLKSTNGYELHLGVVREHEADVRFRMTSGNHVRMDSSAKMEVNRWFFLAATYDGSHVKLFVNGALEKEKAPITGALYDTGEPIVFGRRAVNQTVPLMTPDLRFLRGKIDEARIARSARSLSWIATEYRNQDDPLQSIVVGAPEPGPPLLP